MNMETTDMGNYIRVFRTALSLQMFYSPSNVGNTEYFRGSASYLGRIFC